VPGFDLLDDVRESTGVRQKTDVYVDWRQYLARTRFVTAPAKLAPRRSTVTLTPRRLTATLRAISRPAVLRPP
jgi:hypothetical protein